MTTQDRNGPGEATSRPVRKDLLVDGLTDYLSDLTPAEPPAVQRLREATHELPQAYYQMSPAQTAVLTLLVRATATRRFLEVGTFTGLTALSAALAMPEDGRVVTLDIDPRFPALGAPHWEAAGVADRIHLMLAPARQSLRTLIENGSGESFDMVLVDADKEGYPDYYEAALALVRPGGLVLLDNMLWRGRVLDPDDQGSKVRLFRTFNCRVRDDPRVHASLLPCGDGLMVAYKQPQGA